jgi:hypothetical protein
LKRHPSILATLAMLLLASCEPSQENADSGDTTRRDREGERASRFRDSSNPERIAARDSIGKPPLPRNLLTDIEGICPVHHEVMKAREIPIVFSDTTADKADPAEIQTTAEFPFGAEKIMSSGNALLPSEPISARVYQCAACIAARKSAEGKRTATALQ